MVGVDSIAFSLRIWQSHLDRVASLHLDLGVRAISGLVLWRWRLLILEFFLEDHTGDFVPLLRYLFISAAILCISDVC